MIRKLAFSPKSIQKAIFTIVGLSGAYLLTPSSAFAQAIIAAPDGTNTTVQPTPNGFAISGGQVSGDGANLFHSFQRFGLDANQVANFLSNPNIQNILGRVVGGEPSLINGILRVSGSNANLYLINPAGIIFGPSAQLNVPGSFIATTATSVGLDGGIFDAIGPNDYQALVGLPNRFAFNTLQPADVRNEGQLAVSQGRYVMLLGGNVVNTGTISAPGGNVTIAPVPGNALVRVSQDGMILSLELPTAPDASTNVLPPPPPGATLPDSPLNTAGTLPRLLAGPGIDNANRVVLNPNGTLQLTGSNLPMLQPPSQPVLAGPGGLNNPDGVGLLRPGSDGLGAPTGPGSSSPAGINGPNDGPVAFNGPGRGDATVRGSDPNAPNGSVKNGASTSEGQSPEASRQARRSDSQRPTGEMPDLRMKPPRHLVAAGIQVMDRATATEAIEQAEETREKAFANYFGRDLAAKSMTALEIKNTLAGIEGLTQSRSAIIYVNIPKIPTTTKQNGKSSELLSVELAHPLELLVFTAQGQPIKISVPGVTQEQLLRTVTEFRNQLVTSFRRGTTSYLEPSQQLYQWLIAPIEAKMGPGFDDTLLFSMDSGLRSLPIAALHDGNHYLIEKYSLGMTPAIGLMDPRYRSLKNAHVLAMGASTFNELPPLPAVPVETQVIAQLWKGKMLLNQDFTRTNLLEQRHQMPYQIIHLATHAEFNPGTINDSYIQLWQDKLRLSQLPSLGWDQPEVDLLVLSACQTALGSSEAELGFAGIAVASKVKSALASLWSVSDEGTLALMTEFYEQLRAAKVKSEALRQAQLALLHGETEIRQGKLVRPNSEAVTLPADLDGLANQRLSHPYFWAGFTMIGSPW